jgi:hypothetical protein
MSYKQFTHSNTLSTKEPLSYCFAVWIQANFFVELKHPSVWNPLLSALLGMNFVSRCIGLEDVFALLHDNTFNSKMLHAHAGWQNQFFKLLTDVPKTNPHPFERQIHIQTANILTTVHHNFFINR